MLTYAIIFIIGALAMLALRRLLVVLLRWSLMIVGVVLAGRLALMADDRLAQPSWLTGAMVGGGVGLAIMLVLGYAIIYHSLIAADERRDIERAHEQAKRRRLW